MERYTITAKEWKSVLNKVQILEKENQRLTGVIEGMEKAFSLYGVNISLKNEKTKLIDWHELSNCSARLRNGLIRHFEESMLLDNKIIYVEDITPNGLRKFRNIGRRSWAEFFELRRKLN